MPSRPTTIDAYLAPLPGEQRALLQALRKTILAAVPRAEECISYGIPAFRLDGAVIGGFAARRDGGSFYPFSGSTLRTLKAELAGFRQTKSALHFGPNALLPATLVRKLLRARIAEARGKAPAARRRSAAKR